jgi:hypothetical protein
MERNIKMNHAERLTAYNNKREAYHDAAVRIAQTVSTEGINININQYITAVVMEDGAFVECTMWIPKDALNPPAAVYVAPTLEEFTETIADEDLF